MCLGDASDVSPLDCDLTQDPKDAPGCVDDRVGIFVSPTGSDANPGTKEAPVQTLAKALQLTKTLKRLYICEGTYVENVVLGGGSSGRGLFVWRLRLQRLELLR